MIMEHQEDPRSESSELLALNVGNENYLYIYDEHEKTSHSKLREAFSFSHRKISLIPL